MVFTVVLTSAFFQASWNFLTKKSRSNKIALLAVGWFGFGVVALPLSCFFTSFAEAGPHWIYYILGSGIIHAVYLCLLGWAYALGDISVVFPISRGLGIVGVAFLSTVLGLDVMSLPGIAGIAFVVAGIFAIGLNEFPKPSQRKALLVAVSVAVMVALYSIVDSRAVKTIPPFFFLAWMNLLAPLFAAPFLLTRLRPDIVETLRHHKWDAFWVTMIGMVAYTMVLWSFQRAPVAYVSTLREFSIVMASLLGVVVLKESTSIKKMIGIGLIIAGVVLIKLA